MVFIARKSSIESNQLTDTIYFILLCLSAPSYGYALMAKIEEITDGTLKIGPGSMYTTLKKMLDAGLVEILDRDTKTYVITQNGRESLIRDFKRRRKIVEQSVGIINDLEGEANG